MAAILQLRQGSTSTYISQGPNIAEPFFDTGSNILIVGKSATEVIKLTKLDESNAGSFEVSGDYTGSNLYLSGDLTASNANLSGDITIGGNIILGDAVQDNITISGQFDSDLIPSASGEYDLGSTTKKWNQLYVVSASIDSVNLDANLPSGLLSSSNTTFAAYTASIASDISTIVGTQGITVSDTATNAESLYGFAAVRLRSFDTMDVNVFKSGGTVGWTIEIKEDVEITGSFTGSFVGDGSELTGITASIVEYNDILNKPTLVSGSQQVTELLPSGVVSGSVQVLGGTNIVSSSVQVVSFLPNGTISGSTQITNGSYILSSSVQTNGFDSYATDVNNRLTPLENSTNLLNAVSHSHSNKVFLDTVNQNLSTTDDVEFNELHIKGTASFDSNVTIYGDFTVFGTESIVNATNLSIADNMIYLNSGSTITNPDLGWAGNYNDGVYAHAGIFRDASDGKFKFFDGYTPEPEGSIDTSHVSFTLSPIQVASIDSEGDIVTTQGNVTAVNFIGTGSQLVFPGTNLVSSSQQVIDFLPTGTVSGSTQITNGSNLVSSSQQVIDFLPTGTVSGSVQVLGGTNIVSSSQQVQNFLPSGTISGSIQIIEILEVQTPGLVSGSDQVTSSLDLRYVNLGGNDLLSSSNENFSDYSQSVDTRLLDTLSSGSATSQSLYTLVGNFPTSGSLGTAAFYNVSSSLADDPSTIPNVKAVYDYINNVVQAADITGVSASLGLFRGGFEGYVSLSLDTASAHFTDGVQSGLPSGVISGSGQISFPSSDNYQSWTANADNFNGIGITSGNTLNFEGGDGISTEARNPGNLYITITLDTGSSHFTDGVAAAGVPAGTVSGSQQVINLLPSGVVSGSSQVQITQLSQIDDTLFLEGTETWSSTDSLLITPFAVDKRFDEKGVISGSSQVEITQLSQINDTLFLQGTEVWSSTDSLLITPFAVDKRIDSKGLISGSSQVSSLLPSGVVSGSSQTVDHIESSTLIAINQTSPSSIGAVGEIIINGTTNGYSGVITLESGSTTVYNQYATESDKMINFLASSGYGLFLQPDNNSSKAWVIDTDGDFVSQGTGDVYAENVYSTNAISGSQLYLANGANIGGNVSILGTLSATSITGDLTSQLPTGTVSGSQQIKDLGFVDLSSTQTISGTKTFNDIVVNGTGSFAYIQSTAGSAKIIGDAFIVLNNDTPTSRYAGLSVYDSGSANTTASLQFDGQTNDWFYEYSTDGGVTTDHGVVLFGPEYSGIGSPTYLTNNKIPKSVGSHHLNDSNITDNGTTITLGSNTNVSGVLTATQFTGMISGSSQVTLAGDVTGAGNANTVGKIQGVAITSDEATQLANIGTTTISSTQWGYLGVMNQNIRTTDNVTFNTVSATGDIVAYASSDRRLKDEIQPISDPISKINQIGGYSFVWNSEKQNIYNGKDYGVIAQEIEEILPELVQNRENGYKAVKYDKLVSLLIEGIKELSKEVEDLKKKIN